MASLAVPSPKSTNLVSFPSTRAVEARREIIQQHGYNTVGAVRTVRAIVLGRMRPDMTDAEIRRRLLIELAQIHRSARYIIAVTEIGRG